MKTIGIQEKKKFIEWLLAHHQMKQRQCYWILKGAALHERLLEHIHFVDDITKYSRGLKMSVFGRQGESFVYRHEGCDIGDPSLMYHHIRTHFGEDLFVELDFPNKEKNKQYLEVLLDATYPDVLAKEREKEVEELLVEIMAKHFQERILNWIDKALDEKNEQEFNRLTEMLKAANKLE